MKAIELRQENLIYTPDGVVDRVTDIAIDGCVMTLLFGQMYDLEPIPLTEEWLIKFGFRQGGYDLMEWAHKKHDRIWFVGVESDCEDNTNEWLGWNYNIEAEGDALDSQLYIKTVHQLQNLYFALTGEELESSN